jgi:hypothetical protein
MPLGEVVGERATVERDIRRLTAGVILRLQEAHGGAPMPYGRVYKSIQSIPAKYSDEEIFGAWENYMKQEQAKFLSVESFVRRIGLYVVKENSQPKDNRDEIMNGW